MEGWFRVPRSLLESDLWLKEPFTRSQAWLDLIGLANHKDGWIRKRGIRVVVKRGEVGWSERELAKRWKWSRGKLRRFWLELENEHEIEPQKNNVTSCIRLINYDVYQGTEPQTVPQTDHRQYQNKNEENEENKNTTARTRARECSLPADFIEFWKVYPKKVGKQAALRAWQVARKRVNGSTNLLAACLEALEWQKKSQIWVEKGGQYVPHPATYLNQGRWEDEPVAIKRAYETPLFVPRERHIQ